MILKLIIALITLTPLFTLAEVSPLENKSWHNLEENIDGARYIEFKNSEVIYNGNNLKLDEEKVYEAYAIPQQDQTSICILRTHIATVVNNKIIVLTADYKKQMGYIEGLIFCNTLLQWDSRDFGNPFRYTYEQVEVLKSGDALSLTVRVKDNEGHLPDLSTEDLLIEDLVANCLEIQEYRSEFPFNYYIKVDQNPLTKF